MQKEHCQISKSFIENGSYMTEGYNLPTVTPPSWATICTGAYPRTHGVEDYYYYLEGESLEHKKTCQAFGSGILTAETIWDAWDKVGKKSLVVNYPMSWPSKMANGVMVMGEGLSPAETRWKMLGNAHKEFLASEGVISTDFYPMGIQVRFDDAKGWANLPEGAEEPLEARIPMVFKESMDPLGNQVWYGLTWESADDGYDVFALCPDKDFSKAFCVLRKGEWSGVASHTFTVKADKRPEKGTFRCKLIDLSDDAESFKLYLTGISGFNGFISPQQAAKAIDLTDQVICNDMGLVAFIHGIIDMDTVVEVAEFHSQWLVKVASQVITANPDWDLFYMHTHLIDWFYHGWLSEMDSADPAIRQRAYDMERKIYQIEDRLLGKLLEALGDEPVVCLCSDHGATPMGPIFNTAEALKQAGLCHYEPKTTENYWEIYEESEGLQLHHGRDQIQGRAPALHVRLRQSEGQVPRGHRRAGGLRDRAHADHRRPAGLQASRDRRAARAPGRAQGGRQGLRHGRSPGRGRGLRAQARIHGRARLRPAHRRKRLRLAEKRHDLQGTQHQAQLPLRAAALAGRYRADHLLRHRQPHPGRRRGRADLPDPGEPEPGRSRLQVAWAFGQRSWGPGAARTAGSTTKTPILLPIPTGAQPNEEHRHG